MTGIALADYEPVLEELGYTKSTSKAGYAIPTYTQAYEAFGDCLVLNTNGTHLAAIVDGKLVDTFDHRLYDWNGASRESLTTIIYHKWNGNWKTGQETEIARVGNSTSDE